MKFFFFIFEIQFIKPNMCRFIRLFFGIFEVKP